MLICNMSDLKTLISMIEKKRKKSYDMVDCYMSNFIFLNNYEFFQLLCQFKIKIKI